MRLTILVGRKRGCQQTDVITPLSARWYRNETRQQQRKIRSQAFKFFFRLFLKYVREACFSLSHSLGLRRCVRPGLIRGNVCLCRPKKHFNDTRISSLYLR